MKLINVKQDFEINHPEIISSEILTNSNQKLLLMTLLHNHKKFNMKHYSFTLSEELCGVLKISNPTFRKERDSLEDLKLIRIKVMVDGKMKEVKRENRRHHNLYYYFNWDKLSDLGFITLKKHFKDVFTIGETMTLKKALKLKDDECYNVQCFILNREAKRIGNQGLSVKYGKDIKSSLKIMQNSLKHGDYLEHEYIYKGLYRKGQSFM